MDKETALQVLDRILSQELAITTSSLSVMKENALYLHGFFVNFFKSSGKLFKQAPSDFYYLPERIKKCNESVKMREIVEMYMALTRKLKGMLEKA